MSSSPKIVAESPTPHPVLRGFDYVELFVGNVRHAAHFYQSVWGFEPVAFQGFDAGAKDRISIAMRQGTFNLVLTGAPDANSPIAETLRLHGEGVAAIAFSVDDASEAFRSAVLHGATPIAEPTTTSGEDGEIIRAEIKALDGFSHVFVDRKSYVGAFLPGFRPLTSGRNGSTFVDELDHVAIAVERGTLDSWVDFYQRVFGFEVAHREDVATEKSGMNSRVVQDSSGTCKFPLVEPAVGKRKSQVQEFLDLRGGPGVQHLAFATRDIVSYVRQLRGDGVEFLRIPSNYYDELERRVGALGNELPQLRDLGILVDHDEWGRVLQIFARSSLDRPTMFVEVVERRGARGFGGGNIRALFESIEREQALRGTL